MPADAVDVGVAVGLPASSAGVRSTQVGVGIGVCVPSGPNVWLGLGVGDGLVVGVGFVVAVGLVEIVGDGLVVGSSQYGSDGDLEGVVLDGVGVVGDAVGFVGDFVGVGFVLGRWVGVLELGASDAASGTVGVTLRGGVGTWALRAETSRRGAEATGAGFVTGGPATIVGGSAAPGAAVTSGVAGFTP